MNDDDFLIDLEDDGKSFDDSARLEELYGLTPDQVILSGFAIKNLKGTLEIAEKEGITDLDKTQLLGSILIEEAIESAVSRIEKAMRRNHSD